MYHDGLGELGQDKKKLRLATVSFGFFYSYHDGFEKRVEIKKNPWVNTSFVWGKITVATVSKLNKPILTL